MLGWGADCKKKKKKKKKKTLKQKNGRNGGQGAGDTDAIAIRNSDSGEETFLINF